MSPAHGMGGARVTKNVPAPPPAEKIRSVQQAGKKKRGSGGNEFLPACSAPKARWWWEAAHPCVSKEAKPAKIVSLIEKEFCARPLKDLSIFTGFAGRRQAASRWAGSAPVRAQIVAQKRFERRSAIATIIDFRFFEARRMARSAPLARRSARQNPYISIFFVCRFAALQSKFLNPALSALKAQWPKATNLQTL